MIGEISLIYSDNAIPDEPRLGLYVQRDLVATRYSDTPKNVDDYDAFDYSFGFLCPSAENMAQSRLQARAKARSK